MLDDADVDSVSCLLVGVLALCFSAGEDVVREALKSPDFDGSEEAPAGSDKGCLGDRDEGWEIVGGLHADA
jgi:hypothetical protein